MRGTVLNVFRRPDAAPAAETIARSALLLLIVIIPMLAGLALYLPGEKREAARKALSLAAAFFALAGTLWLLPAVLAGKVEYRLVNYMQHGLFLRLDLAGWIFACIISLIWFLATLFSWAYMDREHNRRRYYSFLIFTLGATLGVVCAGDFFTLLRFFELMTFSSLSWSFTSRIARPCRPGPLYLYLGVAGAGPALRDHASLTPPARWRSPCWTDCRPPADFYPLLTGFGIKAAWCRCIPGCPGPSRGPAGQRPSFRDHDQSRRIWHFPGHPGALCTGWARLRGGLGLLQPGMGLLWIGMATMFLGALMALLQSSAKHILPTAGQPDGYIAMGLGAAAFEGLEGGMGFFGGCSISSIMPFLKPAFS